MEVSFVVFLICLGLFISIISLLHNFQTPIGGFVASKLEGLSEKTVLNIRLKNFSVPRSRRIGQYIQALMMSFILSSFVFIIAYRFRLVHDQHLVGAQVYLYYVFFFLLNLKLFSLKDKKLFDRLRRYPQTLLTPDIVFHKEHVEFSPYVFRSTKINPMNAISDFEAQKIFEKFEPVKFSYEDLTVMTIRRKNMGLRELPVYFLVDKEKNVVELERSDFYGSEDVFINTFKSYAPHMEFVVEDELTAYPLRKYLNKKVILSLFVFMLGLWAAGSVLYSGPLGKNVNVFGGISFPETTSYYVSEDGNIVVEVDKYSSFYHGSWPRGTQFYFNEDSLDKIIPADDFSFAQLDITKVKEIKRFDDPVGEIHQLVLNQAVSFDGLDLKSGCSVFLKELVLYAAECDDLPMVNFKRSLELEEIRKRQNI